MAGPEGAYSRILLTGGTGFVGAFLAPALAAAWPGAERVLLRRPGEQVEHAGWRIVDAEIDAAAAIASLVADLKPDLVLHLAAQASVAGALKDPATTWRINRDGTVNLARAVTAAGLTPTFIFVSSSEIYGENFRLGPAAETTPPKPMSVYAESKFAAEQALREALAPGARLIVVRPFNHTGPGQDERFVLAAFAAQVAAIEAGRQPPLMKVGNLEAERDFLDVRDVCAAYLALARAAPRLPALGEPGGAENLFNIASGRPRRVGDLIEMLRSASTARFEVQVDPARLRPNDIPRVAGVSERLTALTGWTPSIPLETTLADLLASKRAAPRKGGG